MKTTENYYKPIQLKLPVDYERIIDINDSVYSLVEVLDQIDLKKYLAEKDCRTGRPQFDPETLLRITLFAFMEYGYVSLREIEKLCKTDIRFLWMLGEMKAPSHMTIANFINNYLKYSIEEIFGEINAYIFAMQNTDLSHVYFDGTKVEANANKYTWVWKKSCLKSKTKVNAKVTELIKEINAEVLIYHQVRIETREEYAIDYLEMIIDKYLTVTGIDPKGFVYGKGKRKTQEQRYYDLLLEYTRRLKTYGHHITVCGERRNSYSKTDTDATFMRVKKDYMGNDQLLPAYNFQIAVCDEYIAVYKAFQYASDADCFQPLMQSFYDRYKIWPEYPVGDAGYGSYNNYLFCEEHGMKKYMKFSMFKKETTDMNYHSDPFRSVNFKIDDDGDMICPGGRKFHFLRQEHVKGNQYGRTEEYYQCEDCEGCKLRSECHKSKNNRIIKVNEELTFFHKEVIDNLNSITGALLRMNRSIQAEGAFGMIKWNRNYKRLRRRGIDSVMLEFGLICCGFNLHKYHLKKQAALKAA